MGRDETGSNRYPTDPFQATDPDADTTFRRCSWSLSYSWVSWR